MSDNLVARPFLGHEQGRKPECSPIPGTEVTGLWYVFVDTIFCFSLATSTLGETIVIVKLLHCIPQTTRSGTLFYELLDINITLQILYSRGSRLFQSF